MIGTQQSPEYSQREQDYRQMPLLELVRLVYQQSNAAALREIHSNRPVFHTQDRQLLVMVDYLAALKGRTLALKWCGYDAVILDQAYDLTLAKFLNIPVESDEHNSRGEIKGPDCRYYYGAFYGFAVARLKQQQTADAVTEERIAAVLLQRMVMKHFYLSCLEARRQGQKFVKRYPWKVNGKTLCIWLSVDMTNRQASRWLQENIPDVDPGRPGERDRVQAIIDQRIARKRMLSFCALEENGRTAVASSDPVDDAFREEMSVGSLAQVVADEKADCIEYQRPAIQKLGVAELKQLIHRIFGELAAGRYRAVRIAADFELSQATFSRFAGTSWSEVPSGSAVGAVPDLWRNTAHVLASHSSFVSAARRAGVWPRVQAVLDKGTGCARRLQYG